MLAWRGSQAGPRGQPVRMWVQGLEVLCILFPSLLIWKLFYLVIWEDKSWWENGLCGIEVSPSCADLVEESAEETHGWLWRKVQSADGLLLCDSSSSTCGSKHSPLSTHERWIELKSWRVGLPSEKWLAGLEYNSLQKQQKIGKHSFMPIQIALVPRDLAVWFTTMKYSDFNHHCLVQKL